MPGASRLPSHVAPSHPSVSLFSAARGRLQRELRRGEYDIFKFAPIFESDFIQITRRGQVVDVHNRVHVVTVGVAATNPTLSLPDVMLLARPAAGGKEPVACGQVTQRTRGKAAKTLELTRLFPLKFVRISIHNREKQQLRLKFATGRSCHLQLCPPREAQEDLFAHWEKLVYLLRPPLDSKSGTHATPAGDMKCLPAPEDKDRRSPAAVDLQGNGDQDQAGLGSVCVASGVAGVTLAALAGREEAPDDSHQPTAVPEGATPNAKPRELDEVPAAGALSVATTRSAAPGQLRGAIAGAAAEGPEASQTTIAVAGAAATSPKSIPVALAGAAGTSSECPPSSGLPPEASVVATTAEAEPTNQAAGESAADPATGPRSSALPRDGGGMGPAARPQAVSPARAEARQSRRERRARRGKERALQGSRRRRSAESQHKAAGDKTVPKPPGRSLARQRSEKKKKGHSSPPGSRQVPTDTGSSPAPVTTELRTPHKPGPSSSTTCSGAAALKLSSLGSFWRNVKANLTAKAVASSHRKDMEVLRKTSRKNSRKATTHTAPSSLGLQVADSVIAETTETVTFEAHD